MVLLTKLRWVMANPKIFVEQVDNLPRLAKMLIAHSKIIISSSKIGYEPFNVVVKTYQKLKFL